MNFENYKRGFEKPTIITGEQYGTKISVQIDHSDTELDELMDAFETIATGLGYHKDSWKNWILERASEYQEEENDKWDLNGEFENVRHQYESRKELEDEFFGKLDIEDYKGQFEDWKNETPDEDRYLATDEDEDEFSNDGGFDGRPHFEWGDEPEDDDNLFEGDEWFANDKLKAANERYKKEVKKMNTKKRNNKN
jgi:hypothetical protein